MTHAAARSARNAAALSPKGKHPMGPRTSISGFSLVELMIALVLGLVVIGAAVSIFLSNQQTFRTTENLARLQENARFAFESMAREVREAGGTPCGMKPVANVINGGGGWWSWNTQGPLRGYAGNTPGPRAFGTTPGLRATNTDAILVLSASLFEGVTITTHDPTSAQFKVNKTNHGIQNDEIVMACDRQSAAIFQVTNANQANATIVHNTGGTSPGNCSKGLGIPTDCTSANGTAKTFSKGGFIARLNASFWYIGNNDRGGRSLYRLNFSGAPQAQAQEIAEGVTDMLLEYLQITPGTPPTLPASYVSAASVTDWANVVAVRLTLIMATTNNVGVDGQAIPRTFMHVISLREREFAP